MAIGLLTAAVSPSVWVAIVPLAVLGLGNGAAVVYNSLLVQRGAPDELRGRAFTVIMSSNFALVAVAMIVAGPLTDAFGPRWVYAGSAVLAGAAAVVGYALAHGIPAQEEGKPEAVSAVG
jgi:ENTS family enterobactin (siderophore) exporter